MAAKSASVLARIEPDIKEQAEAVMGSLGISASTVINLLYHQIILTQGIPFPLTLKKAPLARDEMDQATFDARMQAGLDDAKAGRAVPLEQAFERIKTIGRK